MYILLTMQVNDAVKRFPLLSLHWTIEWEDQTTSQPGVDGTSLDEKVWLKVPLAMECIVKVELIRRNHFKVSDNITVCTNYARSLTS